MCAKPRHHNPPLRWSRCTPLSGPGSNGLCPGGHSLTVTIVSCSAENVLVLHLAGEIDLRTVERLRECLYGHLSGGAYRGIVLDCTEVTFLAGWDRSAGRNRRPSALRTDGDSAGCADPSGVARAGGHWSRRARAEGCDGRRCGGAVREMRGFRPRERARAATAGDWLSCAAPRGQRE